jgi:hypothetical protein
LFEFHKFWFEIYNQAGMPVVVLHHHRSIDDADLLNQYKEAVNNN